MSSAATDRALPRPDLGTAPERGGAPAGTGEPRAVAVQLENGAVRVGGRILWSGVSASVRAGEFAAVLGPNGVGKSTLIKTVLGMQPLAEGTIEVLGQAPGRARGAIGYLPQRRAFDPSLRIRGIDVVRLGLDGHRWGLSGPRRSRLVRQRADEMIALVGATAYARRPIGQLSGGEQQRLLIAQALVSNPKVLLLDEPLDSLDLPNSSAVATLIGQICAERGIAVLMVAHDVNPILPYLDQVIYLAAGGAASGTPTEVITTETLSRLYGTTVEVMRTAAGRLVVVGQPEPPALHSDRHHP